MQPPGVPVAAGELSNPDFVEYHIFLSDPIIDDSNSPKIQGDLLGWLLMLQKKISSLINGMIWQQDPFQLKLYIPGSENKSSNPNFGTECHIYGRTNFGDNIDDEWLIVWILLQISKAYPQLLIRVFDSDGEFLLIEAAYVIPRWLKPETSEFRIWIHSGQLLVIPPPRTPADLMTRPAKLDITAALRTLRSPSGIASATTFLPPFQEAIDKRVADFPRAALEAQHVARCLLPEPLARVLQMKPQLVSAAVVAFYERDLEAMRAIKTMKHFSMTAHPLKPTMVRFSRTLYAQLSKQRFQPPVGSNFPAYLPPNHPDFKALDLGVKLACGFEILCARKKCSSAVDARPLVSDFLASHPIASDSRWHYCLAFIEAHSNEVPLERHAAEEEACLQLHRKACARLEQRSPGAQVLHLLSSSAASVGTELPFRPDDPDDWLNVTPQAVNDLLEKKQREIDAAFARSKTAPSASRTADIDPIGIDEVAEDVTTFINTVSSHEGAEAPRGSGVDLNADAFLRILRGIAGTPKPAAENPLPSRDLAVDNASSDSDDIYGESDDDDGELPSDEDITEAERAEFMQSLQAMEAELSQTTMADSFERTPQAEDTPAGADHLPQVDLNLNLMKNLMESLAGQQGNAGPFANLLSEIAEMKKKSSK